MSGESIIIACKIFPDRIEILPVKSVPVLFCKFAGNIAARLIQHAKILRALENLRTAFDKMS